MATIVKMPQLAAGGEDAGIQAWLVAAGEQIEQGTPLAEIETEKAVVEYESDVAGVFAGWLVDAGSSAAVGKPIAVIAAEGESIADALAEAGAQGGVGETGTTTTNTGQSCDTNTSRDSANSCANKTERIFASPLARKLAREHDVPVSALTGTGPNGRIVRRDVEQFIGNETPAPIPAQAAEPSRASTPATAPSLTRASDATYTDVPHTSMRKAIARRLTESKSTVPHFYLRADVRVDALLALRKQVNERREQRVSVNDLVVKAVAAAHVRVPKANAIWTDQAVRRFDSVDIAVAVSVDDGLLTPVLRGVESKSLTAVSDEIRELAGRAREGRLKQHELEGGAFSVSNLGMYGTREFAAIINPPQSGILAVGAADRRAVVNADGELEAATIMTVTLSADHRVVDGALAAEWLAAFVDVVEHPLQILI